MAGSNLAAKFVAYPISATAERRGRPVVNWVAEVRTGGAEWGEADWNRVGSVDDVLAHFADWRFDWLDVPALMRGAGRVFEYPMVDRDPLPWWTSGRVTLLGDAAHPMYPIGSNGASQAVIDARVLAWHAARARGDVASAFAAYEGDRRETVNRLVLANRELGPEKVMAVVAQRAPTGFRCIEDVMTRAELDAIAAEYKRTAGFDVEALNTRPSFTVPGRDVQHGA